MVAAKDNPLIAGERTPNRSVRNMGIGPVRFTVDDALTMVQRGILPEDATVELLEGELVYRDRFDLRGNEIVEGIKHNYVINPLATLQSQISTADRQVRTQSTLICSETHAPIPDAVVLRGTLSDYRSRLPTAADAFCVIEVADASYERDAGEKLISYARSGVAQYIIINLRNRSAEVYASPDAAAGTYPPPTIVSQDQPICLRVAPEEFFKVTLRDILP